ncbi:MAG: gamma-glutamylcyclotransferase, partial [Gammaproteobacteria bacterium]|nr:gamma-glutamylcyclotransferase [Gammaproteobacteria bacterium]
SEYDIAQHICRSEGPSGTNSDYLLDLANSLRDLGLHDQHVFDIEVHILEIQNQ